MVHLTEAEFPPDIAESLLELEEEYKDGDITEKGYLRKKCKLVKSHLVKTVQERIQKVEDDFKEGKSTEEQFISHLKELLTEVGHKISNGCGTTPLSPASAKDEQNGLISEVKEEPMETEDAGIETGNIPSEESNGHQGIEDGPSGSRDNETIETGHSDVKPKIDSIARPSCSSSAAVHDKDDTQASSLSSEGESSKNVSPSTTKDKKTTKSGKETKRQPGIKEMFAKGQKQCPKISRTMLVSRNKPDMIRKGLEMAGIVDAVANEVEPEDPFKILDVD